VRMVGQIAADEENRPPVASPIEHFQSHVAADRHNCVRCGDGSRRATGDSWASTSRSRRSSRSWARIVAELLHAERPRGAVKRPPEYQADDHELSALAMPWITTVGFLERRLAGTPGRYGRSSRPSTRVTGSASITAIRRAGVCCGYAASAWSGRSRIFTRSVACAACIPAGTRTYGSEC
jgi:hypothetical protein